ncbi:hypothetical protein QBC37DRAFT_402174 [Rhypophila decipiens]|uniref:Uncharacterized protein n=1 Tax=Rhypophila decipiens TaxID=261697 RepID=A0AAN6Y986_9PEZI|nr:hypothetical protein QBC37DRAFT_402174 [Rhypophila decipiens]
MSDLRPLSTGSSSSSRSSSRNRMSSLCPPSNARSNLFSLLLNVLAPLKPTATNQLASLLRRRPILRFDSFFLSGLEMVYLFATTLLGMLVTAAILVAVLVVLTAVMTPVTLSLVAVVLKRKSGRLMERFSPMQIVDRLAFVSDLDAADTG